MCRCHNFSPGQTKISSVVKTKPYGPYFFINAFCSGIGFRELQETSAGNFRIKHPRFSVCRFFQKTQSINPMKVPILVNSHHFHPFFPMVWLIRWKKPSGQVIKVRSDLAIKVTPKRLKRWLALEDNLAQLAPGTSGNNWSHVFFVPRFWVTNAGFEKTVRWFFCGKILVIFRKMKMSSWTLWYWLVDRLFYGVFYWV